MTMQRSFYIGGFCISVHFTAAVTVAALMISDPGYSLIAVLCAALHELGHIMAARLCGTAVYGINFTAFGAELKTAVCKSYRDEIIICLGGPLMNVAAGALFFGLFLLAPCVQLLFAAVCCAFLAAVNMLPAAGFDGSNVLKCLLLCRMERSVAEKVLYAVQICAVLLLAFAAVRTAGFCNYNISVAVICGYLVVQTALRR